MKQLKYFVLIVLFSVNSYAQEGLIWKLDFQNTALGPFSDDELVNEGGEMSYIALADNSFVVEDEVHPNALRVMYPEGAVGPSTIGFSGSQFIKTIPDSEEYYLDYYMKFEEGFDFQKGGKLPGLTSGGALWTGGTHPENGEGWSARYMWLDNGRMVVYLYYVDMPGAYGEPIELNMRFVPGKWYRLTQRIKLNDVYTPGNGNGVIQVWVDGVEVVNREDLRLRFEGQGFIDSFYFSTFFGGADASWAPDVDSYTRFDSFRVTTEKPVFTKPEITDSIITANLADATVWETGEIVKNYRNVFAGAIGDVGISGAPGRVAMVIPFALPTVPEGKIVESAVLKVNVETNDIMTDLEMDIYALPARTSPTVVSGDYFGGEYGTDANATEIQQSIVAKDKPVNPNPWPETGNPPVEMVMSADAGTSLATFINDQYESGAEAGQYIFLRLNCNDDEATGWNHTQVIAAEGTVYPDLVPKLVYTYKDNPLSNKNIEVQILSIYPNPVESGEFTVSTEGMKRDVEMTIFNASGKLVNKKSLKSTDDKVNVNVNLTQGIYIIKLTDGDLVKTSKISIK